MPGMIVPENPVTAMEPGLTIWPSCARTGAETNDAPSARASMALAAPSLPRRFPLVRSQANKRSMPQLRGMMLLPPMQAGETARRDARRGAKRAVRALSPLTVCLEPLLPTICVVLPRVNGTKSKPAAPWSLTGRSPRWMPGDPADPLHLMCMVMGLSSFRGRTIAAPLRQSRRRLERFIARDA